MNLKEIKEMIALMNENNLTELEVEREDVKIRLKKGFGQNGTQQPGIFIERFSQQENQPGHAATPTPAETQAAIAAENKNLVEIKSPMVGTFYRSPSPEAAAFVEAGTEVEIGQVICIIEAMKLMNEIKAEVKGIIKEILVDNARPIEFGQVLFKIERT